MPPKENKHRLTKEISRLKKFEEDLNAEQQKFDMIMLDKKAKESIRKNRKERGIASVKSKGSNAPLAKYYREKVHAQGLMEVSATGLGISSSNPTTQ